jgi:hypothetical protein
MSMKNSNDTNVCVCVYIYIVSSESLIESLTCPISLCNQTGLQHHNVSTAIVLVKMPANLISYLMHICIDDLLIPFAVNFFEVCQCAFRHDVTVQKIIRIK